MKKYLVGFIVIIGIGLAFPNQVAADRSYTIDQYDVDIQLQKDGSANYEERILYQFDGAFNGVFYDLNLTGRRNDSDISAVEVRTQPFKGKETAPYKENSSGENQTYQLTKNNGIAKFKVFNQVTNAKQTVIYRYHLRNVVTNYRDIAELNQMVIGKEWQDTLNNVQVTIHLPEGTTSGDLRAWAHGSLNGNVKLENNHTVRLTSNKNPANSPIEARVIFPTSITSDNQNKVDSNQLDKILSSEKTAAENANKKRKTVMGVSYSLAGLAVIILIVGSFHVRKITKKEKFSLLVPEHLYDIPVDITPAVMYHATTNQLPRTTDLTATIMDLVRKGQLTIEEIEIDIPSIRRNKKREKTFLIKKVTTPKPVQLLEHERYLQTWLIEEVGNGQEVTLKQIEDYGKKDVKKAEIFTKKYSNWQQKVKQASINLGYIKSNSQKALAVAMTYGVVLVLLGIGTILTMLMLNGFYPIVAVAVSVAAILSFVQWIGYFPVRTLEGETAIKQWAAFKQMLKDVSNLKMADVGSVILWDHFLVYAISLGVSKEVINALAVQFPQADLGTMNVGHYYLYGAAWNMGANGAFNHAFESSFTNAMGSAISNSSNASGTGGGFSGGSSGGFGGGGGGAF
ncbi:DUF2207 domain-containing protein [Carnobacterium divergens]|uniref:DUF2207 domain-containing protein n=1 Tax=Carnobacterium divergens TaxID=2748 RepID=UPI0007F41765|nr:DUF2207 domain-containing protein [Carnobacterium divergens]SBO17868.1 conserved membrane hypothetical protein [Carnobacterium divergens]